MSEKQIENQSSKDENSVSVPVLLLSVAIAVVATVAFLHHEGMLKHTESKEDYVVGDLKAVFIEQQEDQSYRLSHKPSNLTSTCHQGYLFVVSDKNPDMQGLVVDYKNRGIKCPPGETKATNPSPATPAQ